MKKKIVWCNDKWIYENIWKSQKLASTVKFCVVQGFIYNYIVEPHYSLILILSSGSNSIWIQEQGDIWPKWIQIFLPDLKVSYLWGTFYSLYQSAVSFWLLLCTIQFYRYFKILGTQIHTPYKIHIQLDPNPIRILSYGQHGTNYFSVDAFHRGHSSL